MNPSKYMVQIGGGGGGGGGSGSGAGGDGGWGPSRWFRKKKDGPAAVTLTLVSFAVSRKAYSRVRPPQPPMSQRPLPAAELQAAGNARVHLCTVPGLPQQNTGVQEPPSARSHQPGSRVLRRQHLVDVSLTSQLVGIAALHSRLWRMPAMSRV